MTNKFGGVIALPESAVKEFHTISKADKTSISEQFELAVATYIHIRQSSLNTQETIYHLLNDPNRAVNIESLELLSKVDNTTIAAQLERAQTTYLAIRSLPEIQESEIFNLINHYDNRNKNGK
jgi:hypothetical protein